MAITTPTTPTRRSALRGFGLAAIAAGLAVPALASTKPDDDAAGELIRICHQFAEAEITRWYRAEIDDDFVDDDIDHDTYNWIAATPATTPGGWQAKALAYAAFNRHVYDDYEEDDDDREEDAAFLAALLREMVAPARNAIVSRISQTYGPLPSGFSAEGIWVGPSPEEKAELDRQSAERLAARIAAVVAEHKGTHPPITDVPGQELIGVDEAGNMSLWSMGTIEPLSTLPPAAPNSAYIDGGHYVIWWKRHAITVHLSGARDRWIEVQFMCRGILKKSMLCNEVEALLIGKVSQSGEKTSDNWDEQFGEFMKRIREARLAEEPNRRRGHISGSAVT
jgi:hypothetical protein